MPVRGLSLGWRLGLTTAFLVTVVLGSLTAFLQKRDLAKSREYRETLLAEALAPLASDVEAASDIVRVRERISSYEGSYAGRTTNGLRVLLRDSSGRVVYNPGDQLPEGRPEGALYARTGLTSRLLPGGSGFLEVWQTHCDWQDLQTRRWRQWALSLAAAALCIVLSLYCAHHYLVGRPLARLLEGVDQMEQGYWSGLEIPRGAWEMRWLAFRFRNLGNQLEETVRRLVEAERRTQGADGVQNIPEGSLASQERNGAAGEEPSEAAFPWRTRRQYLLSQLRFLEARDVADPAARRVAEEIWREGVLQAARAGDPVLKSRLEDAAFRILEPAAWTEVRAGLDRLGGSRKSWLRNRERELKAVLKEAGLKPRLLQSRIKNCASIWRKMQSKGLALEQIHDIFAFRIILGGEKDCYTALAALHKRFEPLLLRFKDYIAEPKANGYQSLHTCLRSRDGVIFEVQIRTAEMHSHAEGGRPAHWKYKGRTLGSLRSSSNSAPPFLNWLRPFKRRLSSL